MGGMVRGQGLNLGSKIWVLDPVSKRWQAVDVRGGQGVDKAPVGRYVLKGVDCCRRQHRIPCSLPL